MENQTLSVPNITCGHCVQAIKNELSELDGVQSVEGDPSKKEIQVQFSEPATLAKIKDLLQEINYPAAG